MISFLFIFFHISVIFLSANRKVPEATPRSAVLHFGIYLSYNYILIILIIYSFWCIFIRSKKSYILRYLSFTINYCSLIFKFI